MKIRRLSKNVKDRRSWGDMDYGPYHKQTRFDAQMTYPGARVGAMARNQEYDLELTNTVRKRKNDARSR